MEDAASCRELATMVGYGRGARARVDRAKPYAERGCALRDGAACRLRALFDADAPKESASWLALGCEEGDGWSCFALTGLTASGLAKSDRDLLEDGCDGDAPSVEACTLAALRALARGDAASVREAIRLLEQPREDTALFGACDLHHTLMKRLSFRSSGCDFAMQSCPAGCDAQCDAEIIERRTWLKSTLEAGCGAGDLVYCDGLGRLLARGAWRSHLGTILEPDAKAAEPVFTKNCDAGFMPSCEAVGELHEAAAYAVTDEAAAKIERAKAHELYERACSGNLASACFRVAESAAPLAGMAEYRKACKLGMRGLCSDLAEMYAKGQGVVKDEAVALEMALAAK
ncbi:MAG: hypothetical protein U0414_27200 [Polyangiaceae bacterium]